MIPVFMLVVTLATIVLGELNYAVLGRFAECVERFVPVPYDFMVIRYGNLEISPTNRAVLERRSLDQVFTVLYDVLPSRIDRCNSKRV